MDFNRGADDSAAYLASPSSDATDPWTAVGGTQLLLEVAELEPPHAVADVLELEPGERVVLRRRLMLMKDKPLEIADNYYPASIAAGTALAEAHKIRGGAPALLAGLGFATAYADETIDLDATPTDEEAALLQISPDKRVVRLFRPAYTADGAPFEVASSVMLPEGRTLRHRVTAG